MAEVDFDRLAAGYAHRPPGQTALTRARRELALAQLVAGEWAVDVGGGPGIHAAEWPRSGARALVIDPTTAMLQQAERHPGVAAVRATAQRLPLRAGSAGMVYFHLSIHYGSWQGAIAEAVRVLRPGGRLAIWTIAPADHRTSGLARWFPSIAGLDAARFPQPAALAAALRDHPVEGVTIRGQVEHKQRSAGEWEAAVRAGYVSTLQLLDAAEIDDGLAAFRSAYPRADSVYRYQLRLTRVACTRVSLP